MKRIYIKVSFECVSQSTSNHFGHPQMQHKVPKIKVQFEKLNYQYLLTLLYTKMSKWLDSKSCGCAINSMKVKGKELKHSISRFQFCGTSIFKQNIKTPTKQSFDIQVQGANIVQLLSPEACENESYEVLHSHHKWQSVLDMEEFWFL